MARGGPGAFGGKKINSYPVWLGFCALFLLGLADWRRPLSLRNLDLLALLSFSVSLWYFNRGNIFTSAPLVYPPLLYLIGRGLYIGFTGRATRGATRWPVWVLLALTMFAAGLPRRAQRALVERDRRRLFGRDRRRAHRPRPGAVRPHAGRGDA